MVYTLRRQEAQYTLLVWSSSEKTALIAGAATLECPGPTAKPWRAPEFAFRYRSAQID